MCELHAPTGKTPVFNASTTGPIIFAIDDGADIAAFCNTTAKAYSLTISAYDAANGSWPTSKYAVQGFTYVKPGGTEMDATTLMGNSSYTTSGRVATFKVTLCSNVSANLQTAFYFTNGNEVCAVATVGTQGTVP